MYNIETLAKMSGLTRRTIRYYIQRGLLDPPEGGGRGSYYTDAHLKQLKKIIKWANQGVPIIHMKTMLDGKMPQETVDTFTGIKTTLREEVMINDDIRLSFTPGRISSSDLEKIQNFIRNLLK